jgi:hypothetical protein
VVEIRSYLVNNLENSKFIDDGKCGKFLILCERDCNRKVLDSENLSRKGSLCYRSQQG